MLYCQHEGYIIEYLLLLYQAASMVQWLGFYPSKVEVGVRFTVVAFNNFFKFFSLVCILILSYGISR